MRAAPAAGPAAWAAAACVTQAARGVDDAVAQQLVVESFQFQV